MSAIIFTKNNLSTTQSLKNVDNKTFIEVVFDKNGGIQNEGKMLKYQRAIMASLAFHSIPESCAITMKSGVATIGANVPENIKRNFLENKSRLEISGMSQQEFDFIYRVPRGISDKKKTINGVLEMSDLDPELINDGKIKITESVMSKMARRQACLLGDGFTGNIDNEFMETMKNEMPLIQGIMAAAMDANMNSLKMAAYKTERFVYGLHVINQYKKLVKVIGNGVVFTNEEDLLTSKIGQILGVNYTIFSNKNGVGVITNNPEKKFDRALLYQGLKAITNKTNWGEIYINDNIAKSPKAKTEWNDIEDLYSILIS